MVNAEHASGQAKGRRARTYMPQSAESAVAYQTRPRVTKKSPLAFMYVPSNLKLWMTDY